MLLLIRVDYATLHNVTNMCMVLMTNIVYYAPQEILDVQLFQL